MQKTFVVTGAAGFVGSNFIRYLLYNYKGCKVIGLDYIDSPIAMHNIYANKSHDFYIADVNNKHIMRRIFEIHQPDYIIHCVSPHVESSNRNILKTNSQGVYNILDSAGAAPNDFDRIIFISNGAIYGKSTKRATEQTPTSLPTDIFTASILNAENVIFGSGVPHVIFRTSPIFGPRKTLDYRNRSLDRISHFYTHIDFGTVRCNTETEDLLYVEDLSAAIMIAIENKLKGVYNLSIENDFTDEELFHIIQEQTSFKFRQRIELYTKPTIKLNSQKFKEITGWKPQRSLRARIQQTILWYENNKWFQRKY
ncbi:MAG TPA: NAD(P)-dependent oxidoreductase [Candidatus Glassbacteria bacterium]|nr:NAD(P)-dependent oxidoreductase [Candidatus Glassbacteria bacterium]